MERLINIVKREKRTAVMGILNVTPDSFSDGNKYITEAEISRRVNRMIAEGADIIDIGGQSTRPDYTEISPEEEISRISAALNICLKKDIIVSVDTYFPSVAKYTLEQGAHIINDVRGIDNLEMLEIIKKYNCGYVIMHNKSGSPEEIADSLLTAAKKVVESGIQRENIILDCGIGFNKGLDENIALLKNYDIISSLGYINLIGASNKRFIGALSNTDIPSDRTGGTIAAHIIAVSKGADIIRVHDVKAAKQSIMTADAILKGK